MPLNSKVKGRCFMSDYEIYVFLLCLIVFLLLTALSVVCLSIITKLTLRLINCGEEDQKILEEYKKSKTKKGENKVVKILDHVFSGLVCFALLAMLIGSMAIRCTESFKCDKIPNYRVVKTGSMAQTNEKNTYLTQNGIDNHLQIFDLIKTEKLPAEEDLKLYDIVVYEVDGMMIVHRIVEIEEPNEYHPDCRHFRLQGDAVEAADRFPVLYEQMRAIYSGTRIPFIGSFIMFMQSPAGWLCVLLVVAAMIASPILDKKLAAARAIRLDICLEQQRKEGAQTEEMPEPVLVGGNR